MKKTYTKIIFGALITVISLLMPISVHRASTHTIKNDATVAQVLQTLPAPSFSSSSYTLHITTNTVFAAETTSGAVAPPSTNRELATTLEAFLKVVYVIMWPLLWLAGQAMDNSLIYGEFLGIDKPLFQFWSIMKNFANFAL